MKYSDIYKYKDGGKTKRYPISVEDQSADPREYSFDNLPPRQGPLAFVYPDTYKDNQIAKQNIQESVQEKTQEPTQEFEKKSVKKPVQEPVKQNKKPVKTQDVVKERYQAFFPNPAKTSNEALTSTPTYYGGKEQNMSQYPMTTAQKLIHKSKEAAEADRQYNFGKALTNVTSFVPGPIGYGANMASGAIDIAEGNEVPGAMQFIPNRASRAVSGFNNLMTSKDLYDYSTTPEKTYPSYLPYYTDEYKRELFKPQSLTSYKNGGIVKYLKDNYYNKLKK